MKTTTLILRNSVDDYFFPLVKKEINVYSTYFNKMDYYWYKILNSFHFDFPMMLMGWKHEVNKYERIIIFDYGWKPEITEYIKHYNKHCKIHLFFFNVISNEQHKQMLMDRNIDKYWSFDSDDIMKYGLNYNSPMYTNKILEVFLNTKQPTSDVVFVGKAKNREKIINEIQEICRKYKMKIDFHVIKSEKDYINYMDYMKLVMNAKCILDITNENQKGLTLRFMEAIFMSKKIITNNKEIRKYSFYNSDNIFVLGIDNIADLNKFILKPYRDIEKKELEYYDINAWIDRFV